MARLVHAAREPADRFRLDAILILENSADPYRRGLRILHHADPPAVEILRRPDARSVLMTMKLCRNFLKGKTGMATNGKSPRRTMAEVVRQGHLAGVECLLSNIRVKISGGDSIGRNVRSMPSSRTRSDISACVCAYGPQASVRRGSAYQTMKLRLAKRLIARQEPDLLPRDRQAQGRGCSVYSQRPARICGMPRPAVMRRQPGLRTASGDTAAGQWPRHVDDLDVQTLCWVRDGGSCA